MKSSYEGVWLEEGGPLIQNDWCPDLKEDPALGRPTEAEMSVEPLWARG